MVLLRLAAKVTDAKRHWHCMLCTDFLCNLYFVDIVFFVCMFIRPPEAGLEEEEEDGESEKKKRRMRTGRKEEGEYCRGEITRRMDGGEA